uniref:Sm domain-containing protein n=1 Tax=Pinguiococcus pyrenoidosus TaxID=172671 RepID=A0A7R9YDM9_9STRA|mmetsp:Transcript_5021/g.20069  ORF Transcript_5021/g.20069 Transcript_5021/m.20069 type:complete len:100 (+) Transcript_5021:79-378(+)
MSEAPAAAAAEAETQGAVEAKTDVQKSNPSDFLRSVLGRPVVVKLNSTVEYRGILACLDGFMNIAMEQTEEYVNGQLKAKYGDCFIRGNNVLYISAQKR